MQHAAATAGAVFGLLGLFGFVPGLTMHLDDLGMAGEHASTLLFGLFAVSVLHNVIHLLFAVAGLALATSAKAARWYLVVGGVAYLLLALLGFLGAAGWVPFNTPDGWLHLGVGVVLLCLSFLPDRGRVSET